MLHFTSVATKPKFTSNLLQLFRSVCKLCGNIAVQRRIPLQPSETCLRRRKPWWRTTSALGRTTQARGSPIRSLFGLAVTFQNTSVPRPPTGPLFRALWSLLDGIWGLLKGSWGVLVVSSSFGFRSCRRRSVFGP